MDVGGAFVGGHGLQVDQVAHDVVLAGEPGLLKQQGAKGMAARISRTKYPVSRPDAALADPYDD